jgi:hypothetical protein
VQTLANSYRDYARMIRLVLGWREESFSTYPDISAGAAILEDEKDSQVLLHETTFLIAIQSLIIQRYQPNWLRFLHGMSLDY